LGALPPIPPPSPGARVAGKLQPLDKGLGVSTVVKGKTALDNPVVSKLYLNKMVFIYILPLHFFVNIRYTFLLTKTPCDDIKFFASFTACFDIKFYAPLCPAMSPLHFLLYAGFVNIYYRRFCRNFGKGVVKCFTLFFIPLLVKGLFF
jgi:hypothetical protein